MSLIAIKDLSLIRAETLFAGLDLSIAKGDRLGLVAANGRGKSSLLRIMAGEEQATGGTLTRSRGLVTAFAPQDPPARLLSMCLYDAVRDVLDAEAAETESWRVDVLLDDLAVDAALRSRPVGELSGGWQRSTLLAGAGIASEAQSAPISRFSGGQKARLAMLLLRLAQPNFYLLDEPTNHLDIEGQDRLERELIEHEPACLLVSHDRAFVRAVATRIWVIDGKRLVEVDDPDPVFDRLMAG